MVSKRKILFISEHAIFFASPPEDDSNTNRFTHDNFHLDLEPPLMTSTPSTSINI